MEVAIGCGVQRMLAWSRTLGAWEAALAVYRAIAALGMPGCMLAVAAGLLLARWGLHLTDQHPLQGGMRLGRALGALLQVCGAGCSAMAAFALARHMVR